MRRLDYVSMVWLLVASLIVIWLIVSNGTADARPADFCERKPDHHHCAPPTTSTTTTTTVPFTTTSTTTSTTVPQSGVLWAAGHEVADPFYFTEWTRVSNSGGATHTRDCTFAHTGSCSAKLTVGSSGGTRLTYQGHDLDGFDKTAVDNLPDAAMYSAWYFLPEPVTTSWWNIFQWKQGYQTGPSSRTARELYWLSVYDDLTFGLHSRFDAAGVWDNSRSVVWGRSDMSLPVGRWFQLEAFYRWDRTGNGRVVVWLDGQPVIDVGGLFTEGDWAFYEYNRQWTVNNYGSGLSPAPFTIWVDDAQVVANG